MRLHVPSLYLSGAAAIIVAVLLRSLLTSIDVDLWWHLANGRYILDHARVPDRDWMSFTAAGAPWVDQWWLAEVFLYGLLRSGGLLAIYLFFATATALTFLFVHLRMLARGVPPALALTLLVPAAIASAFSWGARIQVLSLCLASIFLWLLDRHRLTGSHRHVVPLPILMLLWVNIHGAFALGLGLIAIELVSAVLERNRGRIRPLGLVLVASAAATLVNPAVAGVWQFPLGTMRPGIFHSVIAEAASPNFHHPAFVTFEILLLLLIAALFASRAFQWRDLFLTIALTHLSLSQTRHIALWAVCVTPIIAAHFAAAWRERSEQPMFTDDLSTATRNRLNLLVLVFVTVAYVFVFGPELRSLDLRAAEQREFPVQSLNALARANRPPADVFTTFEWGGYVAWRLYPNGRVFIDGRANSLYEEQTLREYLTVIHGQERWTQILRQYEVRTIVIPVDLPLARLLRSAGEWTCSSPEPHALLCRASPHFSRDARIPLRSDSTPPSP